MTENAQKEATIAPEPTSETTQSSAPDLAFHPRVRRAVRSKHIRVRSVSEIGALIRLARRRLAMNQVDAAACCGVGRRFFVDVECGKPNVQFDKLMAVLDSLGIELSVGGAGALFSLEELAELQIFSDKADETYHLWEIEFTTKEPAPYKAEGELRNTHPYGRTDQKRLENVISTEKGCFVYDERLQNLVRVDPNTFTLVNGSQENKKE